jgi:hypothetical protein
MKANEFIKEKGISVARNIVAYSEHSRMRPKISEGLDRNVTLSEFKRLVESHDICEAVRSTFGDHDKAFDHFTKYKVEFVRCTSYSLKLKILVISKPMLKKAIADVGSCQ